MDYEVEGVRPRGTHTPPPPPFYGLFSGTTRVSRCQKKTSGVSGSREDQQADTDHLAGRHSIRTNHCPPPPSPDCFFYSPDALSAAQPTVSKQ